MSDQYTARTLDSYSVWPLDRIKDHASKIGSGVTPTGGAASYLESGVPLLRSQNIHFDGIRLDDIAFISADTHADMAGSHVRSGDVLLNITGASIGRCAIVPEEFGEGNVNQHVCIIRPTAKLQASFLHYCLSAPWGQDQILSLFTGASRQGLGQRDLGAMLIPLPPIAEQRRIAAFLNQCCKAIDDAVASKREQLHALDRLRRSIISEAVTGHLSAVGERRESGSDWFGDIPIHWGVSSLKRIARRIQTGLTPPTETPEYYEDGTIPWFAPGSFGGDIELRAPRKLINEIARRDGAIRLFPSGSVFLIGIGATIGKVGLITFEASCNQQIIGIVTDHHMLPRFLAYQLSIYESVIPGIATATTLPIFDQVKTGYLPVLVPPIEEQHAICNHLDARLAKTKSITASIDAQIDTLDQYRKSLIHEYVTGQRRVPIEHDLRAVSYG